MSWQFWIDRGGTFTDSIGHYSEPIHYERIITEEEIDASPELWIVFEFTSDNAWSDEDCHYSTVSGPFGADSISIYGPGIEDRFYDFEDGLQGWEAAGLAVTPSVLPKVHAQGPVIECRPVVVDRDRAYGGAFKDAALNTESAGG